MISDIFINTLNITQDKMVDLWPLAVAIAAVLLFIRFNLMKLIPLTKSFIQIVEYTDTVSKNISSCDKAFYKTPVALNLLWRKFRSALENKNSSEAAVVYEYFDEGALWMIAERRKSEFAPQVLAVLGILGALINIANGVLGAEGFDSASEAFSVYALEAVAILLTCFLISFIYFILDRITYSNAKKRFGILREKLAFCAEVTDMKHCMEVRTEQESGYLAFEKAVSDKLIQVSNGIIELKTAVLKVAEDFSGKAASIQQEALNKMTSHFVEGLQNNTEGYYIKIAESMSDLTEAQIKAMNSISSMYSGIEKAANAQVSLNEQTTAILSDMSGYIEKLKDGGEILAVGLSELEKVTVIMNSLPGAVSESIGRLEAERKQFSEESRRIIESIENMESTMGSNLSAALENIFNRFSDITGAVIKEYEENSSLTVEKLSDTIGTMLDKMDEKLYAVNIYSASLSEDVKYLTGSLDKSVENFREQLQKSVNTTFESFDTALADITQRLGNTAEAIRDSVEELPSLIAAAKSDQDKE